MNKTEPKRITLKGPMALVAIEDGIGIDIRVGGESLASAIEDATGCPLYDVLEADVGLADVTVVIDITGGH